MTKISTKILLLLALANCSTPDNKRENTGEAPNPRGPPVRVQSLFMGGIGSASGTHIGDGNILTNQHVCDMFGESLADQVVSYNGDVYAVQKIYNSPDPYIDLCLIHTNMTKLPSAKLGSADDNNIDMLATVVGYPSGEYSILQGRIVGTTIFAIGTDFGTVPEFLSLLATPSAPGVSGSGVYNTDKELIGVVNAGNGRITLFVPLAIVKEFLNAAIRSFQN